MRIGEVATRAGVSVDTVRYYERRGLLPAPDRRPSGYRVFAAGAVERITLVRMLQQLGLTIDAIGGALTAHDSGTATCDSERWRLESVRDRVDAQIEHLLGLRARIDATVAACRAGACTLTDPAGGPDSTASTPPGPTVPD